MLIALERYLAVCHPFKHANYTRRRIYASFVAIHILAIVCSIACAFQVSADLLYLLEFSIKSMHTSRMRGQKWVGSLPAPWRGKPLLMNRMTDPCEDITLPILRMHVVINVAQLTQFVLICFKLHIVNKFMLQSRYEWCIHSIGLKDSCFFFYQKHHLDYWGQICL